MIPECGKICIRCKDLLPFSSFSRRMRSRDGLHYYCRVCNKAVADPVYLKRRPLKNAIRAEGKAWLDSIKLESGCVDCGYDKHPEALDFDHLPGSDKRFELGGSYDYNRDTLLAEIAKCEVVCANCHRIRTATRRSN
jgi:hypothetical protein